MTVVYRDRCDGCGKTFAINDMTAVVKLEAKQTRSSPAEYSNALVCDECLAEDERDPEFDRCDLKFRARTGSHL